MARVLNQRFLNEVTNGARKKPGRVKNKASKTGICNLRPMYRIFLACGIHIYAFMRSW